MSWTPIIEPGSSLSARAWDAINAITDAVEHRSYPPLTNGRLNRTYEEPLLYGYLALASREQRWLEAATKSLNAAIEQPTSARGYLGLFGGLSGLGWVVEHLSHSLEALAETSSGDRPQDEGEDQVDEDLNAEIDIALLKDLSGGVRLGHSYDLIGGYVGFGVYFLERLPASRAALGLKLVVDRLMEISQQSEDGITWHSGPELLPEWQREQCPGGYYNLGVAHGIPGILFLLSEIQFAGLERNRVSTLLQAAMRWFLAQTRRSSQRSWFNSWIPTPGDRSESRLAWCYGDLGILAVLHHISHRSQQAELSDFTAALLNHSLSRAGGGGGIFDAGLCHGAGGNAHIFNRLYQKTGDERCRKAALNYFEQALAMRQASGGVGGFYQYTRPDPQGPPIWEPSVAFLDGAVGVALGFLAGLTHVEPAWDRMLLLSGQNSSN